MHRGLRCDEYMLQRFEFFELHHKSLAQTGMPFTACKFTSLNDKEDQDGYIRRFTATKAKPAMLRITTASYPRQHLYFSCRWQC